MGAAGSVIRRSVASTTPASDPSAGHDDYLVALGREYEADYIVTGGKDLLEWPEQRPLVLTPGVFAELVGE